ncbi:isoprenylcysteine carboxylmethyltransferase family protein [Croceicoccus ponticola]|uniref:Isoprenylcysteine carboxylmethyltransferase family protein n=1 Tax=Croceicoccus ponticola TaxID=2217664 RepID=A0A437GZW9_9SPHN|nr:isoprenylcysteine carboxylmethyltransferase family protein [Croceicoccus ponticola]RVQ68921.1 isoprenylcysteine carboxylmethyltransferase family protein [Croceicoccus ponticola]
MASLPETAASPAKFDWKAEAIRFAERAFLVVLSTGVIVRLAPHIAEHPQLVLFLLGELVGVFMLLIQRRGAWTVKPWPIFIAVVGTGLALCVIPEGTAYISNLVSFAIIATGAIITLSAKVFLGRSFGVIPANRGVKSIGVYRLVRHPMYLGYMISHIGYVLMYLSAWNVAIYAIVWTALYFRTIEEEKFLRQDESYRQYAEKVRYKLIPGVV